MKQKEFNGGSSSKKKYKKWVIIGISAFFIQFALLIGTAILLLYLLVIEGFHERHHQVHHPAIYSVQENFIKLEDSVYYMGDEYCLAFDNQKESRRVYLKHYSQNYYVYNNKLYIYLDKRFYAYNSELEEICTYYIGDIFILTSSHKNFIVRGDYIYYRYFDEDNDNIKFYKYSMSTEERILLPSNKQYVNEFLEDGIYFNGEFHNYDDNYFYRIGTLFNDKFEKVEIDRHDNKIYINNSCLDLKKIFNLGLPYYLDSDYLIFNTSTGFDNKCIDHENCICTLKEVKLWKYSLKTKEFSVIKQFPDYTILVSFDANNYYYYYDGKLYSNDIEVEEAPKIEVGDIFDFYSSNTLNRYSYSYPEYLLKSFTRFAFISDDFYVFHEEINSDVDEFHDH